MKHLPEIILGIGIVIALAAIAAGVSLSSRTRNPFGPPPRVEVQLGDARATIRNDYAYPFLSPDKYRSGYSPGYQAVTLVYNDPAHRLELPETYGIYYEFTDDRVTEIRVLQYGQVTGWTETEQSVRALVGQMENAGWQPTHSRGTLDEVLASRLAFYKEHQNFMNDQFLDSWTIDGARLDLSLYRMTNESAVVPGQTSSGGRYSFHFTFKRIE